MKLCLQVESDLLLITLLQFSNMKASGYLILFLAYFSKAAPAPEALDTLTVNININDEKNNKPPVTVELYYESFCPGCKRFITTQLFPTFNKLKDTGIMKVGLFPYGNAREEQLPDGSWKFTCQHGEQECQGNMLQACIMNHLDSDSSAYMPVINCMEGSDDPVDAAMGCVRDHSKLNYQDVDKCAKGPEGNALMHQIAVKTEGLSPHKNLVPWIVVNGIHNDDIQQEAKYELLSYVCKIYKGTKPKECTQ